MTKAERAVAPWAAPAIQWPQPPPRESWLGTSVSARKAWQKPMFIDHLAARDAFLDAWEYVAYCKTMKESFGMLIVGESGAGKTTFSTEFERQVNAIYGGTDPEVTIKSALRLEYLPDNCTPREICWALLRELGDPNPKKRDKDTLTKATAEMLKKCEVRAVLLDNCQDIPMARGDKGVLQVGSRLRDLMDATHLLWIFLGTEKAKGVISSDRQLIKRVPYSQTLPYFSTRETGDKKKFLRLLIRYDLWLPLAESSEVLLKNISHLVHIATEGVLDRLSRLLERACFFAVAQKREHLIQEDLADAFALLYGRSHPNPFLPGFVLRRLNKGDEPFVVMTSSPEAPTRRKMGVEEA